MAESACRSKEPSSSLYAAEANDKGPADTMPSPDNESSIDPRASFVTDEIRLGMAEQESGCSRGSSGRSSIAGKQRSAGSRDERRYRRVVRIDTRADDIARGRETVDPEGSGSDVRAKVRDFPRDISRGGGGGRGGGRGGRGGEGGNGEERRRRRRRSPRQCIVSSEGRAKKEVAVSKVRDRSRSIERAHVSPRMRVRLRCRGKKRIYISSLTRWTLLLSRCLAFTPLLPIVIVIERSCPICRSNDHEDQALRSGGRVEKKSSIPRNVLHATYDPVMRPSTSDPPTLDSTDLTIQLLRYPSRFIFTFYSFLLLIFNRRVSRRSLLSVFYRVRSCHVPGRTFVRHRLYVAYKSPVSSSSQQQHRIITDRITGNDISLQADSVVARARINASTEFIDRATEPTDPHVPRALFLRRIQQFVDANLPTVRRATIRA